MPTYRALWNGIVIAESDATIVVDGYRYFPAASVQDDHLVATSHHSVCGWKGQASYYDVTAGTYRTETRRGTTPTPSPQRAWSTDTSASGRASASRKHPRRRLRRTALGGRSGLTGRYGTRRAPLADRRADDTEPSEIR